MKTVMIQMFIIPGFMKSKTEPVPPVNVLRKHSIHFQVYRSQYQLLLSDKRSFPSLTERATPLP